MSVGEKFGDNSGVNVLKNCIQHNGTTTKVYGIVKISGESIATQV